MRLNLLFWIHLILITPGKYLYGLIQIFNRNPESEHSNLHIDGS